MRKKIVISLFAVLLNAVTSVAQSNIGLYNQFNFFAHQRPNLMDFQAWVYDSTNRSHVSNKDSSTYFYSEGRSGYEDTNTLSLYMGFNWNIFDNNLFNA